MPRYTRAKQSGGTFFFTLVTYRRRPILTSERARAALRGSVTAVRQEHPFEVVAWVLLPDHLHCIWQLPEGDQDYSKCWGMIKSGFSKQMKSELLREDWLSASRRRHRESSIWQRRFWEHQVRDDDDLRSHLEYIHYNPVKHGLVTRVADWPWSTFHRYVRDGIYTRDWACALPSTGDFGE